jgi:FAD/FMN-containing dehydrogenase
MAAPTADLPIDELRAALRGRVITPDEPDYDEARTIVYGGFDRRPAAIARVADAQDAARVVLSAREHGLDLAVRGGGHSVAGHSTVEAGVVLDLRDLDAIEIDREGRTAWAGGGATTGAYTQAAGADGLATGFGDTGSVGIGGLTVAGGIGYLVRKHGLTIDSLLAAEVVTADGEVVQTDADSHPDLFWAIRGGGGNLGVLSRLRFRLHEVGTIVGGMLVLPAAAETIEAFVAEAAAAPNELSTIANVMPAPPMPFLPEEVHGRMVILAMLVYAGEPGAGERALLPFRAIAEPLADMMKPMPYPEVFLPDDPDFHPVAVFRTTFSDAFDRTVADAIVEGLEASSAPMRVTQIRALGGAMARVADDATAFAHRGRPFMLNVAAVYEDPDQRAQHAAWVDALADQVQRGPRGAYTGFLGDEGEPGLRAAYPEPTMQRLAAVKARYDPDNLFRGNHNVRPA